METLIVKPKNIEELHFVQTMLNRMRIKSEVKEVDKKKRLKKEFLDSFEKRVEQVNQDLAGEIKLKTLSIYSMNFKIEAIDEFEKDLKKLSKKYPSLKKDFEDMLYNLLANPQQGEPLGKDCYKIRMAISSKGQGKSGGARLITNVKIVKEKIYLIAIYDKSDMENISDKELKERLKGIK